MNPSQSKFHQCHKKKPKEKQRETEGEKVKENVLDSSLYEEKELFFV